MRLRRTASLPTGWTELSHVLRRAPSSSRSLDVASDDLGRYVAGIDGDSLELDTPQGTIGLAIGPKYPHIRWWGDDVLVVDARTRNSRPNAWIVSLDGEVLSTWCMGDDIEDLQIVGDIAYASYGDEGMSLGGELEPQGLVGFDREGEVVFRYERDIGEPLDFNNRMVAGADSTIVRCSWGDDLAHVDPVARTSESWRLPRPVRRIISAMSVRDERAFFVMTRPDYMYEWDIATRRGRKLYCHLGKRDLRGLPDGRFLEVTATGFRVIEAG